MGHDERKKRYDEIWGEGEYDAWGKGSLDIDTVIARGNKMNEIYIKKHYNEAWGEGEYDPQKASKVTPDELRIAAEKAWVAGWKAAGKDPIGDLCAENLYDADHDTLNEVAVVCGLEPLEDYHFHHLIQHIRTTLDLNMPID